MRLHHQSHNRCGLKQGPRHYGIEADVIAVERPTSRPEFPDFLKRDK
jgi:hypothetical protein